MLGSPEQLGRDLRVRSHPCIHATRFPIIRSGHAEQARQRAVIVDHVVRVGERRGVDVGVV